VVPVSETRLIGFDTFYSNLKPLFDIPIICWVAVRTIDGVLHERPVDALVAVEKMPLQDKV